MLFIGVSPLDLAPMLAQVGLTRFREDEVSLNAIVVPAEFTPTDVENTAWVVVADFKLTHYPILYLLQRETGRLLSAIRPRDDRAYLAVYGKSLVIETSPERLLDHLGAVSQHCYVVDVAHQIEILNPEPKKALRAAT